MSWNEYNDFGPYVSAAERRRKAANAAKKMAKNGKPLEGVTITGRQIATTFWGREWCVNLEAYSDFENRLLRGRTYVKNGSVIDLRITSGKITALVQGSSLYKVQATIQPLPGASWKAFKSRCAGQIGSLLDLLQGRLDKGVLQEITRRPGGLFPAPREIEFSCSCPDGAWMCKHVAAALYGVGARLDGSPELFFTLRGAEMQELMTAAGAGVALQEAAPDSSTLAEGDLSAIFGVDMETFVPPGAIPVLTVPARGPRKTKTAAKRKTAGSKKAAAKKKSPAKKAAARRKTAASASKKKA